MYNSLPLSRTQPRIHPLAVSLATTIFAAFLLILANKLVGTLGRSAGLKDACWQLTAVRASLAATTVTLLVLLRKDHLLLLGAIYGISLAITHGGTTPMLCAIGAGAAALGLRHALARDERFRNRVLSALLPTLAFVSLVSISSLVNKAAKTGAAAALTVWTPDLLLRLLAATLTVGALICLLPRRNPTALTQKEASSLSYPG